MLVKYLILPSTFLVPTCLNVDSVIRRLDCRKGKEDLHQFISSGIKSIWIRRKYLTIFFFYIVFALIQANLVIVKTQACWINSLDRDDVNLTIDHSPACTYMYRVLWRYKLTASGGFRHTINHSFSLPFVQVANMRNNRWALSFNNTQTFWCHWRKHSAALEKWHWFPQH